jgi:hypothetical protein
VNGKVQPTGTWRQVVGNVSTNISTEPAVSMGTYELRPAVKKAYLLRPELSAPPDKAMYQLRPKVSAACVSYRDMNKPPEETGKLTRRAARDITHTQTPPNS